MWVSRRLSHGLLDFFHLDRLAKVSLMIIGIIVRLDSLLLHLYDVFIICILPFSCVGAEQTIRLGPVYFAHLFEILRLENK